MTAHLYLNHKYISMIRQIDTVTFSQVHDNPSIVKVTAGWCSSCKAVHPAYEKLSTEFDSVNFFEIDADKNVEFISSMGVKSLPTFLLFKDGQTTGNYKGIDEKEIRKKIDEMLSRETTLS